VIAQMTTTTMNPTNLTTRGLPHAQGEEKSVLSSLLKSPVKLEEVPHLTPAHFHDPARRTIFEAILEAVDKGHEVELVSFVRRLHESGRLDDVGGAAAVADIFTYAPNHAHFASHARTLTEKLTLRRAMALASEIGGAVDEGKEPDEVAELIATSSTALSDTLAEAKPASDTRALLLASAQRWEDLASGRRDAMGIETSLVEINQLFCGLKPGRVTVISGLPSDGKSLLGGQFFMDAVSQGHRGLFLTWEMSEHELTDRAVAYQAKLPLDAVANPAKYAKEIEGTNKPTKETMLRVQQAYRAVSDFPMIVRAMHGQNVAQAAAMIRREHRRAPLGLVVMDFIQRIGPSRHLEKQSFERQLADIADRFQNLALELGFHGIVLSQLNKEGAAKHAEAINESCALHLKIVNVPETGRDGTVVTDEDGQVVIKRRGLGVVKDRFHGQTGKLLRIGLNRETQRFERMHQS
jgi:replicative DNA helicase